MEGPAKEASATRVISQPQMLDKLKDAESLLDDIQKGRSANLEEKSLPVLSKVHDYCLDLPVQWFNDELLETCLRQRMYSAPPPHLKPCFEGSAKLTFNHEKEITHMESAENEKVELVLRIIPAGAKGLVEEWLHEILV